METETKPKDCPFCGYDESHVEGSNRVCDACEATVDAERWDVRAAEAEMTIIIGELTCTITKMKNKLKVAYGAIDNLNSKIIALEERWAHKDARIK